MLNMPAEIVTLLKSKMQIGTNRPTGYIELGGQPGTADLKDPTQWTVWRTFIGDANSRRTNGNMEETTDGRAIIAYCEGDSDGAKTLEVAWAENVRGVLEGTETFGAGSVIASDLAHPFCSIARIDGKLCMVLFYVDELNGFMKADFYRDSDGNGADFAKVSQISGQLNVDFLYSLDGGEHSLPTKLPNGDLVVILPYWYGRWERGKRAYYSTDNGLSWTGGAYYVNYYVGTGCSFNLLAIGDDEFLTGDWGASGVCRYIHWTNSGASLQVKEWVGDWGEGWWAKPMCIGWVNIAGEYYMSLPEPDVTIVIRHFTGGIPDADNVATMANWEEVVRIPNTDSYSSACAFTVTQEALVVQHSVGNVISGAGTEVGLIKLRPKSITIDRSKGSASQATIVLDNYGGRYAPDPAGPWHHIIWPNNDLAVYLGYGNQLQRVFTGRIDELTMRSYPAEIPFTARDMSKRALDQMVEWTEVGITYYARKFINQTPEAIFSELAAMAGFVSVITEPSGLTIAEITFAQEQYGDAFQRLAEICGFEWFCDEAGVLYFRKAVEPDPVAVYEFTEGVDIFSLDYTISDAEIYYKVVVVSEIGDGETVWAVAEWSANEYYDLLPQKTMYVQATDMVTTTEQCQELANRICVAMNPKPRQVSFVCVGNAWLQIGDCIRVRETSSTISEIYRIFDLQHQMEAEGSPVFATTIKCYHYAD